jgi:hypothetical protein
MRNVNLDGIECAGNDHLLADPTRLAKRFRRARIFAGSDQLLQLFVEELRNVARGVDP